MTKLERGDGLSCVRMGALRIGNHTGSTYYAKKTTTHGKISCRKININSCPSLPSKVEGAGIYTKIIVRHQFKFTGADAPQLIPTNYYNYVTIKYKVKLKQILFHSTFIFGKKTERGCGKTASESRTSSESKGKCTDAPKITEMSPNGCQVMRCCPIYARMKIVIFLYQNTVLKLRDGAERQFNVAA